MRHRRIVAALALLLVVGVVVAVARPPDASVVIATVAVDRYSSPLFVNTRDGLVFADGLNGQSSARMRVIDTVTGRLLRTVVLPQPPIFNMRFSAAGLTSDMAAVESLGRAYLLGQPMGPTTSSVMALDAHSGQLVGTAAVPAGGPQSHVDQAWLAVDARTRRLFVLTIAFPAVYVSIYDARSLRLLRTTTVSAPPYVNSGWGMAGSPIAVDQRSNRVFASYADSNRMGVLDARDGRLLGTTALRPLSNVIGGNPQIATPVLDERLGRVYVGDFAGAVNTLDAVSGRLLRSVSLGARSGALLVDEPTRRLFVASLSGFSILDAMSGRLLSTIGGAPAGQPGWPVVDERNGHIYAADWNAGTVSVLDGSSGRTLRVIAVGPHPYGMAVDESSGRVFVACVGPFDARTRQPTANGSVSVLDGRRGVLLRTIPAGILPGAVVVDGPHWRALVFNDGGSVVRALDPWGWVPGWLRRRLPFLPASGGRTRTVPGSVTVIDTSRL